VVPGPEAGSRSLCPSGCLYIGSDESIEVVNPATLETKRSIKVPIVAVEGIKSVAVAPDESLVVAALNASHDGTLPLPLHNGKILFIDPFTGQNVGQIDFPERAFPVSMVFTSDGRTLLVLDRANFTLPPEPARLYVIDVAARSIIRRIPVPEPGSGVNLALTPDDAVLFISVAVSDARGARHTTLFPLDTRTSTFNGVIRLPGFRPGPIAMNPSGTRIYAPEHGRPVTVIDTATHEISEISGVVVGTSDPNGAAVSADGRYLVVSERGNPNATVVDTLVGSIVGVIQTEARLAWPIVILR
jgi:DNA-binding beta-propeller fold protein YncE